MRRSQSAAHQNNLAATQSWRRHRKETMSQVSQKTLLPATRISPEDDPYRDGSETETADEFDCDDDWTDWNAVRADPHDSSFKTNVDKIVTGTVFVTSGKKP